MVFTGFYQLIKTGPVFTTSTLLLPHVILGLNEPVTGVEELVVAVLLHHPRSLGNKSLSTYGCTEDSLEKKDKTKDCW